MTMKRWLPALLWMIAIFTVSHQSSTGLPFFGFLDLLVKKGGHFLAYAILAVLVQRAWPPGSASWGWALLITAVYAISDEIHQTYIPGRLGSLADVLIDTSGGLAALLLNHYRIFGNRNRLSAQQLRPMSHRSQAEVQSAQTVPIDGPSSPAA